MDAGEILDACCLADEEETFPELAYARRPAPMRQSTLSNPSSSAQTSSPRHPVWLAGPEGAVRGSTPTIGSGACAAEAVAVASGSCLSSRTCRWRRGGLLLQSVDVEWVPAAVTEYGRSFLILNLRSLRLESRLDR